MSRRIAKELGPTGSRQRGIGTCHQFPSGTVACIAICRRPDFVVVWPGRLVRKA